MRGLPAVGGGGGGLRSDTITAVCHHRRRTLRTRTANGLARACACTPRTLGLHRFAPGGFNSRVVVSDERATTLTAAVWMCGVFLLRVSPGCCQAQAYELFLTSDCSIETAEEIEKKMFNVTFIRPNSHCDVASGYHDRARAVAVEDGHWYCVYEFDMDSHTFLPLRSCFSTDRTPSLPPSLRSPGA